MSAARSHRAVVPSDSVPVERGEVLYLALEDTGRRLQDRLRIILAGELAPAGLTLTTECEPLTEGGSERIEWWLEQHPSARLVIIDVFTRVRGQSSDRTNRYEADYTTMASIKHIADTFGVAFLVVHHTRKLASEDFLDSVSGTNGIAGAADTILLLSRSRGSAEATLKITGRDVEEAEYALNFAADIGTWQMLDGPASDHEVSDERRRILAAVRDSDGLGPKQIADASGVAYDVVKHLVRKMVDADQLDTDGNGHYFPVHSVHPVHPAVNAVNEVNGVRTPDRAAVRSHAADELD